MKDPIINEVRRHRAAHAAKFRHNLSAICADLRRWEAEHPDRMAAGRGKRVKRTPAMGRQRKD